MGNWELGVRTTRADVHLALRRALTSHVVLGESAPASPNFSLHVAEEDGRRGVRDFHVLYRGVTGVVRTRHLRRVVHGLLGYLSGVVEPPDEQLLRLDAVSLVKDGVAVLVPAEVRSALPTIERRLHAKGIGVADRPWATVDLATGALVVGEPQLAVDWAVLDELTRKERATGNDGPVAPGRYPLVGWGFGVGPDTRGPISRAVAVTLAGARLVDRDALSSQDALERLARVLTPLEPVALWADRPEDLVGPLVALFGDHGAPAPGG